MIKKILLIAVVVIVVVVVACCGVVAMQPAHTHIERSATMNAPAMAVFNQVNDFHKWDAWSPWEKLDPNMKRTFEGAPSGTGAVYSWVGNSEVGEGRMTITESKPNELIKIKLEFIKPFPQTSETVFTFKPQGNQTAVTWAMDWENNFIGKAFGLLMNMDKMIGPDLEKGFAQMKMIAEKSAQ